MKRMITVKKNRFSKSILRAGLILISIFYLNNTVASSTVNNYIIERNPVLKDTLYDKENGNIYVLDKNRIIVRAFSKDMKLLWKTDPALDSFLPQYQMGQFELKRPVVKYFSLQELKKEKRREVIWIIFNNSQFGYLLKDNGKFYFLGQD